MSEAKFFDAMRRGWVIQNGLPCKITEYRKRNIHRRRMTKYSYTTTCAVTGNIRKCRFRARHLKPNWPKLDPSTIKRRIERVHAKNCSIPDMSVWCAFDRSMKNYTLTKKLCKKLDDLLDITHILDFEILYVQPRTISDRKAREESWIVDVQEGSDWIDSAEAQNTIPVLDVLCTVAIDVPVEILALIDSLLGCDVLKYKPLGWNTLCRIRHDPKKARKIVYDAMCKFDAAHTNSSRLISVGFMSKVFHSVVRRRDKMVLVQLCSYAMVTRIEARKAIKFLIHENRKGRVDRQIVAYLLETYGAREEFSDAIHEWL